MPRPRKCRRIGRMPGAKMFVPIDCASGDSDIIGGNNGSKYNLYCDGVFENGISERCICISVDEYETLRLIDKEGLSQEECGEQMEVARTTVQQIYNNARRKVAEALVEGAAIKIEGGDYRLCAGVENGCGCGMCKKKRMKHECKE